MNIQYLTDSKGQPTGVFIPIKEWEKLKRDYQLPADDDAPTTQDVIDGIKEALEEVKLHRQGKIKLKSLDELLNEL